MIVNDRRKLNEIKQLIHKLRVMRANTSSLSIKVWNMPTDAPYFLQIESESGMLVLRCCDKGDCVPAKEAEERLTAFVVVAGSSKRAHCCFPPFTTHIIALKPALPSNW